MDDTDTVPVAPGTLNYWRHELAAYLGDNKFRSCQVVFGRPKPASFEHAMDEDDEFLGPIDEMIVSMQVFLEASDDAAVTTAVEF